MLFAQIGDGSVVRADPNEETTTLRCVVYSDRELDRGGKSVPVRVEVTGLNPQVIILLAGHFALDHGAHTVNDVSFNLRANGKIALRGPPLAPITDAYKGEKP